MGIGGGGANVCIEVLLHYQRSGECRDQNICAVSLQIKMLHQVDLCEVAQNTHIHQ
jgi:hypothetical protein